MGEERGKKMKEKRGSGREGKRGQEKRREERSRQGDLEVTGLTENAPPCTCSLTLRKSLAWSWSVSFLCILNHLSSCLVSHILGKTFYGAFYVLAKWYSSISINTWSPSQYKTLTYKAGSSPMLHSIQISISFLALWTFLFWINHISVDSHSMGSTVAFTEQHVFKTYPCYSICQ